MKVVRASAIDIVQLIGITSRYKVKSIGIGGAVHGKYTEYGASHQ